MRDAAGWALLITALTTSFVTIYTLLRNTKRENADRLAAEQQRTRIETKLETVHDEVRTGNGQTLGVLADIAEGRAAQAIPREHRTPSEQEHADMKRIHDDAQTKR